MQRLLHIAVFVSRSGLKRSLLIAAKPPKMFERASRVNLTTLGRKCSIALRLHLKGLQRQPASWVGFRKWPHQQSIPDQ
ncbi:hypothetical protein CBI33_22740 [Rhodococcus erythropolis]|nr:hypothetical protein CBI33_22740 [Rhodococcus erythropolis]